MQVDIRWVQSRLAAFGFDPGPIDGIRGPRTDAAIVAFKKSIGFRARPFIGPLTMAALKPSPDAARTTMPWMHAAQRVRGLHEVRDTDRLRAWFTKSMAALAWVDPRDVPWCGAFTAVCYREWQADVVVPEKPLVARNWRTFGKSCPPVFGACLVFWRGSRSGWRGHVGFCHGEDATHFHVLGGNQRNAVTVTRIAKKRLLDARWPAGEAVTGKRVILTPAGVITTQNEA